jgi:hypothetical protein
MQLDSVQPCGLRHLGYPSGVCIDEDTNAQSLARRRTIPGANNFRRNEARASHIEIEPHCIGPKLDCKLIVPLVDYAADLDSKVRFAALHSYESNAFGFLPGRDCTISTD